MQVESHGRHEGQDHQTEGETAMGEQAEQRVHRKSVAPFQEEHHQHDGGSADEDPDDQVQIHQDGKCNTEQGRVRDRLTEVGKPPPDDEATRRTGDQRQPDAGEQGASEEVVEHGSVRMQAVVMPGARRGRSAGMDRLVVFMGYQDHHVVAGLHRQLEVVRDQQDPTVEIAADPLDQLMEHVRSGDVDTLSRFVQDQQIGPMDQRPGQQQALELAARQRRDRRIAEAFQTDGRKRGVDFASGETAGQPHQATHVRGSVELSVNRCGT